MATAEQIALARKCAAKYWQTGERADEICAKLILDGKWDDTAYVQAALAAIIETTELAAKMAINWRDENRRSVAKGDDSKAAAWVFGAETECNAFAGALRNFDHLKEHPNGE